MIKIINRLTIDYFKLYIYLYIFMMPWNLFNGQAGMLTAILVIWWLLLAKKNNYFLKLKQIIKFKPILIIILYFLYCYASILWSTEYEMISYSLKFYKYYWFIIPILLTSLDESDVKSSFYVLTTSFVLYAFFSLSIYLGIINLEESGPSNPKGLFMQAISSPYIALGAIFTFTLSFFTKDKKLKVFLIIIGVLCSYTLFINKGRAAQVGFIVSILFLSEISIKYLSKKMLFSIFIVFFFIIFGFFNSNLESKNRIITGVNNVVELLGEDDYSKYISSWGQRLYLIKAGANIISENYFFGVGAGDYLVELKKFGEGKNSPGERLNSFHNQHIDILVKYGFIGYSLFISSIVLLIYSLRTKKEFFILAIAYFIYILTNGIGDIILIIKPHNNIFVLIFILLSIVAMNKKQDDRVKCVE